MRNLKLGPWQYQLVRSDPIEVPSGRLFLVARVFAFTRRRATVSAGGVAGGGVRFTSVAPLAVIAEQKGWRRLLPIVNLNRLILWALCGVCIASFLAARAAGRAMARRP